MITANMPEINATDQLSIGEAAAVLGVHRNTMRRYTEQGLIKRRFRLRHLSLKMFLVFQKVKKLIR